MKKWYVFTIFIFLISISSQVAGQKSSLIPHSSSLFSSVFGQKDSIVHNREFCVKPNVSFTFFSFLLKKKIGSHTFRRISGGFGNAEFEWQKQNQQVQNTAIFSADFRLGREKRVLLDDNFWFCTGQEVSISPTFRLLKNNSEQSASSISLGFGWIFGVYFNINSKWSVALETIPGFAARQTFVANEKSGSLDLMFSAVGGSGLTIVRKFSR